MHGGATYAIQKVLIFKKFFFYADAASVFPT